MLISDGMSMGTLTCADQFHQLQHQSPLAWMRLVQNPAARMGLMNTRSLNSLVTDSAAASSAWGSGSRVVNGVINMLPSGEKLTPLYALMNSAGWRTGLVTTAEITHATPAGFATTSDTRGNAELIAVQYLERKIDILLGGGRTYFSPNHRSDKRDLRAEFKSAGYSVVLDKKSLLSAPTATKILGTFAYGHLPYTIDQPKNVTGDDQPPTIAELTHAALQRLENTEKFCLQIEGARIDHAAHNSDAAAAIHEQIALDAALEQCLAFQQKHPDTLLLVTTDHGNSNLGLNGMGTAYNASSPSFKNLSHVTLSHPEILARIEKAGTITPPPTSHNSSRARDNLTAATTMPTAIQIAPAVLAEIVAECTGFRMPEDKSRHFARVLAGEAPPQLFDSMNSVVTQLGQLMANYLGIGWTGNTHTADYVPLIAIGPGSEHFTGFYDNTAVFRHLTNLAGIDFQNPSAPLMAESGPTAHEVESIA